MFFSSGSFPPFVSVLCSFTMMCVGMSFLVFFFLCLRYTDLTIFVKLLLSISSNIVLAPLSLFISFWQSNDLHGTLFHHVLYDISPHPAFLITFFLLFNLNVFQ